MALETLETIDCDSEPSAIRSEAPLIGEEPILEPICTAWLAKVVKFRTFF